MERLHVSVVLLLEQKGGEGAVWPRWDASHIRRQPWYYRGAGSKPRGIDQLWF